MGFSIVKIRDKYNDVSHKEWLIDTDEELKDIPLNQCSPGTEAYSVESGKRFILDNNHEWQDKPNGSSSGDGQDGFSPTVEVTDITGGHRFTITDVNGETTVDVMDGADGQDGTNGTNGVTFTPSVSNAGVWSCTNDGNLPNPQSVDLVAAVIAALPTWTGGSY